MENTFIQEWLIARVTFKPELALTNNLAQYSVDYKTTNQMFCTWRWFLWWSRTRSRTTSVCLALHRCDSVSNALGSWFSFLLFFELSMRSDRPLLALLLSFYNNNKNNRNNTKITYIVTFVPWNDFFCSSCAEAWCYFSGTCNYEIIPSMEP